MRETAADDNPIQCDRHGPARAAFVCQHLVHGFGLGFWHSDNGPYPDAWCSDCDKLMMQTGHWTEEAEAEAGIKIVCHRCYINIRRRNRVRKECGGSAGTPCRSSLLDLTEATAAVQ